MSCSFARKQANKPLGRKGGAALHCPFFFVCFFVRAWVHARGRTRVWKSGAQLQGDVSSEVMAALWWDLL